MNSFTISGRLGDKPMLRKFPSGEQVTDVGICVNRYKKGRNGGPTVKLQDWYTIKCWSKQAEILCTEASTGQVITVVGSLALERVPGEPETSKVRVAVINVQSFELGRMPNPKQPERPE